MLLATGLVCMHAQEKHLMTDIYVCRSCICFILTSLPLERINAACIEGIVLGICHKYCAQGFISTQGLADNKRWCAWTEYTCTVDVLAKKTQKNKKAPLWTHPPLFSPSSVHSLWCASRKRSSKPCSALPAYHFLMKSPNTFWQTYFLRKRKSLLESKFLAYQPGKKINKKGEPQVCQKFPSWEDHATVVFMGSFSLSAGLYEAPIAVKVGKKFQVCGGEDVRCDVNGTVDVIGVTSTFSLWRTWSPQREELKRSPWKVL